MYEMWIVSCGYSLLLCAKSGDKADNELLTHCSEISTVNCPLSVT
jgi:hypothetical protein